MTVIQKHLNYKGRLRGRSFLPGKRDGYCKEFSFNSKINLVKFSYDVRRPRTMCISAHVPDFTSMHVCVFCVWLDLGGACGAVTLYV